MAEKTLHLLVRRRSALVAVLALVAAVAGALHGHPGSSGFWEGPA